MLWLLPLRLKLRWEEMEGRGGVVLLVGGICVPEEEMGMAEASR